MSVIGSRLDLKVVIWLVLPLLGACASSPPTSFFILSPNDDSRSYQQTHEAKFGLSVGVGPILLPGYLDRPQIVTRKSRNALELSEFNQWAEPLEDNFANVLGDNLSVLLPTDDIRFYPWDVGATPEYQVEVEIIHFDGSLGGTANLDVRWTIYSDDGVTILVSNKSNFQEKAADESYEATVAAMNRVVDQLSAEVSAELLGLSKGG